ncbi:hypothetical protein HMPREF9123_1254 [Neisseria bacilliformis ATCC BAA-1200]|uniref:Uncharacterized protein n=1 Tax=Neisseria bacilliformis ATCC BAA-1200 TaxID=888742 RepID=F2BBZ9_9NEIS|nr:hypothetical protein HMPREF9123_1254 [Neisseria bacilliformis ATCC BAA-1200]
MAALAPQILPRKQRVLVKMRQSFLRLRPLLRARLFIRTANREFFI